MIVATGQQIILAFFDPLHPLVTLALGAVPVAAAIIADSDAAAITTSIYMPTQCRRSALGEGTQGLLLVNRKRRTIGGHLPKHIGYFPPRLHCVKTLSRGLCGSFSGR